MTALRLGFIGIGLMGEAMVKRLLAGGHRVTVWNREPERLATVLTHGALPAASPADVAAACDIVLLCVLGEEAVQQCVFGAQGVLSAPTPRARLLVDCSTVNPDATREMAARAARHNLDWIDAPVSGGPPAALEGQLTIMVGGDTAVIARAKSVLHTLGTNVTHMGPVGAGQTAKVINQAIVGVGFALMTEVVLLAEAAGLDAALLPRAMAGGLADSALLQRIYPAVAARDFEPPLGYARQLAKDLNAVRAMGQELGYVSPLADQAATRFLAYVDAGGGDADSRSLILHEQSRAAACGEPNQP